MGVRKLFFLSFFLLSYSYTKGQNNKNSITIVADISGYTSPISTQNWGGVFRLGVKDLMVSKPTGDTINPYADSAKLQSLNNKGTERNKIITWTVETDRLLTISNILFDGHIYLIEPGDSIHITFSNSTYQFSGRGSEKNNLLQKVYAQKATIKDPVGHFGGRYITITEYLKLNEYYDNQLSSIIPLIESNKMGISTKAIEWIKAFNICLIEQWRLTAFGFLPVPGRDKTTIPFSHTTQDLANIWDSTMYKLSGLWLRSKYHDIGLQTSYLYGFSNQEIARLYTFDYMDCDSLRNEPVLKKIRYYYYKRKFSGLLREKLLCYFLEEQIIEEMGAYNWFAQSILRDYYATSEYSAYKGWMKACEQKHQGIGSPHAQSPLFVLEDQYGKRYTQERIKGKFTIINFWYTGCEKCKQIVPSIEEMQKSFKNDTNFIFLNVSIDDNRNKWLKNIKSGVYTPKGGTHLFTMGRGKEHEMVKDFNIIRVPTNRYINNNGKMMIDKDHPYDLVYESKFLSKHFKQEALLSKDGPYVLHENGDQIIISISGNHVDKQRNLKELTVSTDIPDKTFRLQLQKKLSIPPSEYPYPEKMLVLSDIEGNFDAFRKLLQSNQVVDKDFNWTFGNGHLVFAGDMFDRGLQVTECLWLIYSLEEKAQKAGGYVHFILGNHDILNLNGTDRYVRDKYKVNYALLGKSLTEIYSENTELGKWLRTKNIIEKIGNNLFTHGGVSPAMNQLSLTLEEINNTARPFYDKKSEVINTASPTVRLLFNGRNSPFWYRHYYAGDYFSQSNNEVIYHATENQIDSTCDKFSIAHIITGHTIVGDTISVHYNGKVINIDTKHAAGMSEALFITQGIYYRATVEGRKYYLFKDVSLEQNNSIKAGMTY